MGNKALGLVTICRSTLRTTMRNIRLRIVVDVIPTTSDFWGRGRRRAVGREGGLG